MYPVHSLLSGERQRFNNLYPYCSPAAVLVYFDVSQIRIIERGDPNSCSQCSLWDILFYFYFVNVFVLTSTKRNNLFYWDFMGKSDFYIKEQRVMIWTNNRFFVRKSEMVSLVTWINHLQNCNGTEVLSCPVVGNGIRFMAEIADRVPLSWSVMSQRSTS